MAKAKATKKEIVKRPVKAIVEPNPMSPLALADWLEAQEGMMVVHTEKLRLDRIVQLLRSPQLRMNSERRCCASRRGEDVPHAPGCKVPGIIEAARLKAMKAAEEDPGFVETQE
jgi:hypothetical protein